MIEITNEELFKQIVSDAIESAVANSKTEETAARWINAINRAVTEIETNPLITWQADSQSLLICSPSNKIYSANSICQCVAYQLQTPCWHCAAARLVRLYLEGTSKEIEKQSVFAEQNNSLYIKSQPKEITRIGGIVI